MLCQLIRKVLLTERYPPKSKDESAGSMRKLTLSFVKSIEHKQWPPCKTDWYIQATCIMSDWSSRPLGAGKVDSNRFYSNHLFSRRILHKPNPLLSCFSVWFKALSYSHNRVHNKIDHCQGDTTVRLIIAKMTTTIRLIIAKMTTTIRLISLPR